MIFIVNNIVLIIERIYISDNKSKTKTKRIEKSLKLYNTLIISVRERLRHVEMRQSLRQRPLGGASS